MSSERRENLSDREEFILRAVVHSYITTAEPVGSRSIVKRFDLDLSPATVRNVMADLEESGYLEQLHTSSGRVPTDKGYRYYVDCLMRVQQLTHNERSRIEEEFSERLNDVEAVMQQTSHLLALVSHQTGIVEAPDSAGALVRRVEVVPVSPTRAAVMVADSCGRVQTVMVPLEQPLGSDEVTVLNRFLNEHLSGVSVENMASSINSKMREFLNEQRLLAQKALQVLNLLPVHQGGRLYLNGAAQLFEQPEFRDPEQAREVFGLLDESSRLAKVLRSGLSGAKIDKTWILIGSETHDENLRDLSLVASPYRIGKSEVGVLGVLGPRRMPYSKLTSVVDYTAKLLGRFLTRLAG